MPAEENWSDALGTRRGFAVIMTFWSLANASHALATSFAMLMGSRFLLGMGEGGGFPAATRAVAEWFPTKERATAMGIINAGTAVGAVIAPPLIALILGYSNWRWIFVVTGGLGLLWTWWWISSYFSPQNPPERLDERCNRSSRSDVLDNLSQLFDHHRNFAGSICFGFASPGDW